jgi:adenosylcobinamide kinase/adenosylcobinamide-phosphate guanylyltransferase
MTGSSAKSLTLILGGARGGKSAFAQALAARRSERVTFLATAEAGDEEMRARIEQHRVSRPGHWLTIESPSCVAEAASKAARQSEVILLDCLALLVSNLLLAEGEDYAAAEARVDRELADLLAAYQAGAASLIVVSNEVGMGVVPASPLGRVYRDLLGRANAQLARAADEVYVMVAGLAMEIKASGLAITWELENGTARADNCSNSGS